MIRDYQHITKVVKEFGGLDVIIGEKLRVLNLDIDLNGDIKKQDPFDFLVRERQQSR